MDTYITGDTIRRLREKRKLTQAQLADMLMVSNKTVSKWENAKGLPDISLLEPLAGALRVSLIELMSGNAIDNHNVSANMRRSRWYVCPVCGNVVHSIGESVVSCCGITLPALEAEEADPEHEITVERLENEYYVTVPHEMEKHHYISFLAYVTEERLQLEKFYPEQSAECRFRIAGHGNVYAYCNRHGLFQIRI
jgi:transcriptional regulator with XRE-family HTH domain